MKQQFICAAIFSIVCSVISVLSASGSEPRPVTEARQESPGSGLTALEIELITLQIEHILQKDQQFRTYLSFGTIDEAEIQRIQKLDTKGQLEAMADNKSKLTDEAKSLLTQLQLKNDVENHAAFREIVKTYGYPSPERLGCKNDRLFVLLLHPPVKQDVVDSYTREMCELLLPEVKAGRMKPRLYATFVDNMRAKILRLPQLYGTNQQFNPKTRKVLPPMIEDLEKANKARSEIGMPALEDGEYRLAVPAVSNPGNISG